jgi:hypothetical protein
MSTKNWHETLQSRTQSLKRSMARFVLFNTLVKNKRAASAVVSNLILIGAVLAVGLVALGYARSTAIAYQSDYSETMSSDIGKLKETLIFEYAHYGSNQLSLYVMNPGQVNVTVDTVSINNSPVPASDMTIYQMSDSQQIFNDVIAKGVEVKIVLNVSGLTQSGENNVKITSGSGSNFAYYFLV